MAGTSRTQVSIVALTAVFGLGIAFIILGAVSEELKTALGVTNAEIGNLVLTLFLTSVFVQLIVGPMVDKFGYKPVAIVGFLVASSSMFLLGTASSLRDGHHGLRAAGHRRDVPQHRGEHAHPRGALRRKRPGAGEQFRERVLRAGLRHHAAPVLAPRQRRDVLQDRRLPARRPPDRVPAGGA